MKRTVKQKKSEMASDQLSAKGMKIGVVCARCNRDITLRLEQGCTARLLSLGLAERDLTLVTVPGAVEVPLAAKALLKSGCDAVVALGCVIRGETTHYESVCNSVERGCTMLQIETLKPVAFGVITVENHAQAEDRVGGHHGHKGEEAAEVAVEMVQVLRSIQKRKKK